MKITVASLTLRFYKKDGWTKDKIRKLLVNPKMKITFQKLGCKFCPGYYAVYAKVNGKKVFKKSEIDKHIFNDTQNFGGTDWYINENE